MRLLSEQLAGLVEDGRIGTVHLSIYVALLQIREQHRGIEPFCIRRKEVMRLGKIQGKTTYYQCLRELNAWGHVEYMVVRGKFGKCWVTVK